MIKIINLWYSVYVNSDLKVEYNVIEKFDEQDRLLRRTWHLPHSELLHRIGGPALELFDANTGKLIEEFSVNQLGPWPPKLVEPPRLQSTKNVEYRVIEQLDEQDRLLRRIWSDPTTAMTHRAGGPAVQSFDPETGKLIGEIWINIYHHGRHRDGNLPSEIAIDRDSGIVLIEEYYCDGLHHRDDSGPTEIYRDRDSGRIIGLVYSHEGFRDREGDLPAVQDFSEEDGRLLREEFHALGQLHRERGPAVIEYDPSGNPIPSSLQYYRNGQRVAPSEGFKPPGP